jgi:Na+:H+ antiporter, NhaA family
MFFTGKRPSMKTRFAPRFLSEFLQKEYVGGVLLMVATLIALGIANSGLNGIYETVLATELPLGIGTVSLSKSVHHWINDGLMSLFFLVVGLEIKREVRHGELAGFRRALLPCLSALGGVATPALIFLALTSSTPAYQQGWAIPAATDIAFAIGVLSLFGRMVPVSLKIFIVALAILDDLCAVLIIALFYTSELHTGWLLGMAGLVALLALLNRLKVMSLLPYLAIGLLLWLATYKSGIHATIAGVLLAFTIPDKNGAAPDAPSPLHRLEHALHPWSVYLIMPIFALANAGLDLRGVHITALLDPLPLAILCGLFFGKQIGCFGMAALSIRLGWCAMPHRASWLQLYGVSILAGIGFTMSLFIALLAFSTPAEINAARLGVLAGSALSAIIAALVFWGAGRHGKMIEKA